MELWASFLIFNLFFEDLLVLFLIMYMCTPVWGMNMCVGPRGSQRYPDSTGARVPGGCELPEVVLTKPNLDHLEDRGRVFFTADEASVPPIFSFYLCTCVYV